jgi:thioredoxin
MARPRSRTAKIFQYLKADHPGTRALNSRAQAPHFDGMAPVAPPSNQGRWSAFGFKAFRRKHMSEHISAVTDASFEQDVLKSQVPVLVDFWAEWCGPCRMIAPVLEQLAQETTGKLKIVKLNVDENTATPPKFAIRGIPTMILFKNGQVAATQVGAVHKAQLSAFVQPHLAAT